MKKYILFGSITGIGGWQIYIDGKATYLKENGWEVHVFSPQKTWIHEQIKLHGLKEYERNVMPELSYWPYHMSYFQQRQVIDKMVSIIGDQESDDSLIIESTSILGSFWGEILAKRLNAKHFVYLLHSHFNNTPAQYLEYFNFKYDRKELAGMSEETIPSLFNRYRMIDENARFDLKAAGKNPVYNSSEANVIANEIISKAIDCDYIIGGFGTLNKPHALVIFEEVKKFAYKYSNFKVAYIAIGSSFTGTVEAKLKEMAHDCSNLCLILVEEMYPVPEKLFKEMDVCIGSWGSARVAAIAGAKTIRLKGDADVVPQGLIGYTLTEEPYSQYDGYDETLLEILEDVLIKKKYKEMEYVAPAPYPDNHLEYKKHMEFIALSSQSKEYYNMSIIKPTDMKQWVKRYIIMLFGVRKADYFFNLYRKKSN